MPNKEYYWRNRDKVIQDNKEFYQKNKKKINARNRKYWKKYIEDPKKHEDHKKRGRAYNKKRLREIKEFKLNFKSNKSCNQGKTESAYDTISSQRILCHHHHVCADIHIPLQHSSRVRR